jgi:hypothetical protein
MPKSGKRPKNKRRPRRTSRPTSSATTIPAVKELAACLTEEVMEELWLSLCAEATGDVHRAIEHLERHRLAGSAASSAPP